MLSHASATRLAAQQSCGVPSSGVALGRALSVSGTACKAARNEAGANKRLPAPAPVSGRWHSQAARRKPLTGHWPERRSRPAAAVLPPRAAAPPPSNPQHLRPPFPCTRQDEHDVTSSPRPSEAEGACLDALALSVPPHPGHAPSWVWARDALPVAAALGLLAAGPALASTEVAEVGQAAGALSNLNEFQSGFVSSFLLIIFSEIGDKTFFIAALLATRQSNLAVFTGTFGALAVMTVISVLLGRVFHYVDEAFPVTLGSGELPLDDIAAVILLVYFGVSTLRDATAMDGSKAEEEQQEAELAIASVGADGGALKTTATTVAAVFVLVFLAEWGDKSFFATIALAAASSPIGVVLGGSAGHGVATALAVLGGSFLGSYVSEKVVAYTGGILFLVFAAVTSAEVWSKING